MDGNPLVTPEVLADTLRAHRARGLRMLLKDVEALGITLSQSDRHAPMPEELRVSLEQDSAELPKVAQRQGPRTAGEPWRRKLRFVEARLQLALQYVEARRAGSTEPMAPAAYRSPAALRKELELVERTLVQVKAVDGLYPLIGSVRLAGGGSLDSALAPEDGLPGLVAEKVLVDRLGLVPGDEVRLGTRAFHLADTLVAAPDAIAGGISIGPRVIVRHPDLDGSGLLEPGSLFDSSYRLRLPPAADLEALRVEALDRFGDSGLQWRDRRSAPGGVSRFVDRLGAFLILVGLAGLAVGGVGVAAAVRAHLEAKTATSSTSSAPATPAAVPRARSTVPESSAAAVTSAAARTAVAAT
jgi:hypothetical protein